MRVLLVPAPAIAADVPRIVERLEKSGVRVELGDARTFSSAALDRTEVIAGPGSLRCDGALLDRATRLRGLVSIGSGCEGFDLAEAERRGIVVRRGATRENIAGMASATVMLMLALCHDLPGAQEAARAGTRRDIARTRPLDGAVVGLVGYGAIGREVAHLLRAWNVAVQAASPSRPPGSVDDGVRFTTMNDLLATSDIVSLHAALSTASHHLLDRERIARCVPGALLVNTARGGLLDEAALADALTSGAIGGAALDCFEKEPLSPDSPLLRAPNLILTPHQIGHTADGARSVIDALVDNIISFASAAPLQKDLAR